MLVNYSQAASKTIQPEWDWVKNASQPICPQSLEKYYALFGESERAYIEQHLLPLSESFGKVRCDG